MDRIQFSLRFLGVSLRILYGFLKPDGRDMVLCQVFLFSLLQCKTVNCRNPPMRLREFEEICKRLREFEEIKISRQSCRDDCE